LNNVIRYSTNTTKSLTKFWYGPAHTVRTNGEAATMSLTSDKQSRSGMPLARVAASHITTSALLLPSA